MIIPIGIINYFLKGKNFELKIYKKLITYNFEWNYYLTFDLLISTEF